MNYTPKYNIDDMVNCTSPCDDIVINGKITSIHSFEDKPAIYIVKQADTDDDYAFTEGYVSLETNEIEG
tara:strand:+ start:695 stop:901 length:207 start_codon:yes stop_codon:yes gene_type:complete